MPFSTKRKGHHYLLGNVQVYNVRIPVYSLTYQKRLVRMSMVCAGLATKQTKVMICLQHAASILCVNGYEKDLVPSK